MTTSQDDFDQGIQGLQNTPTTTQSPLKAGLIAANNAYMPLTTSLGFPLKFIPDYVTKNIHIHDQLAQKKETVSYIKADIFIPCSI